MTLKARYQALVEYFTEHFPEVKTELYYQNPFQLLVAVILSAQCTDKRVNIVTPPLFEAYPTPESMARASAEDIFEYIKSISYPNNKSKHLAAMARMLVAEYNSEVPSNVENLQKLQGVGRKTANVIVSVIYNQPAMAVDTHVFRVSHRLGLVPKTATTPLAVEKKLVQHIPKDRIAKAHHWLILHGRYVCIARKPKCEICELKDFCTYWEKNNAVFER